MDNSDASRLVTRSGHQRGRGFVGVASVANKAGAGQRSKTLLAVSSARASARDR